MSLVVKALMTLEPIRLKKLCMNNFVRMHGDYSHEQYAQRVGSALRARFVIFDCTEDELRRMAEALGLSVGDLDAATLKERVCHHLEHSGKRASKTYDLLKKEAKISKILDQIDAQVVPGNHNELSEGDRLAKILFSLSASLSGARTDLFSTFSLIDSCWPSPLDSYLEWIGCEDVFEELETWHRAEYADYPVGAPEAERAKYLEAKFFANVENSALRKRWRESMGEFGSTIEICTREFLLQNESLL